MGLYSKAIRKKEEDNRKYEQYADESLVNDKAMIKLEEGVDDAQTTVLYILSKFGIQMDRLYGLRNVDEMLEMMLDPLGMMYDYEESVETFSGARTEYILAFREDGKAVALTPTLVGYRYFCPHDASGGYASKKYCRSLKKGCYIFQRPLEEREGVHATFRRNVLKSLTFSDIFRLLLAAALVAGLGLFLPIISRWVYKAYIPMGESKVSLLLTMMLVFLLVSIIRGFLSMVKTLFLSETKIRISRKMQSAVMARVLHLDRDFFGKTSSGKLSNEISSSGRSSKSGSSCNGWA